MTKEDKYQEEKKCVLAGAGGPFLLLEFLLFLRHLRPTLPFIVDVNIGESI
jgi:hypothetical protein